MKIISEYSEQFFIVLLNNPDGYIPSCGTKRYGESKEKEGYG
jgi:hypothetical protein